MGVLGGMQAVTDSKGELPEFHGSLIEASRRSHSHPKLGGADHLERQRHPGAIVKLVKLPSSDVLLLHLDLNHGHGWTGRNESSIHVPGGAILREALSIVAPDVADFFEFVDMSDNYPFTGTGNLFRFCQGLARIKIQNRILVVLDNDTAGRAVYRRILPLDLPPRMRVTVLPVLEECRNVKTLGPSGAQYEDINGRAVSIEWFLDTSIPDYPEPIVRWTAYNDELDTYQGELVDKEAYVRHFFVTVKRGVAPDSSKLVELWDHLIASCTTSGG